MNSNPILPPPLSFKPNEKKKNTRVVVIVVLSTLLLLIGGIGVSIWLTLPAIKDAFDFDVTQHDYQMVVDIDDLAEWMEDFRPDKTREIFKKVSFFKHYAQFEYEYDDPRKGAPYMNCMVKMTGSKGDAWTQYKAFWGGMNIGLKMADSVTMTVSERNDLFSWGDESRFGLLMVGERPVGNVFVTRKKTKVLFLIFTGVYFENPDSISDFLMPTLNGLEERS